MHGQRKERLSCLGFLFSDHGTQHAGAAHGYHDRACRLSRNTARLQRDFMVTVLEGFLHYIHLFSPNMTRPALGRPRLVLSGADPTA